MKKREHAFPRLHDHSTPINPSNPTASAAPAPVSLPINAGAAPDNEFVPVVAAAAVSAIVEEREVLVALDTLELVGSDEPAPATPAGVPVLRMPEAVREEPLPEVRLGEEDPAPSSAHL